MAKQRKTSRVQLRVFTGPEEFEVRQIFSSLQAATNWLKDALETSGILLDHAEGPEDPYSYVVAIPWSRVTSVDVLPDSSEDEG